MTFPNEVIIIGGGKSIQEGINLGLKNQIKNKFTILTNYAYKTFSGTFLAFQDKEFYVPDHAKRYESEDAIRHPDIYEELKQLPLIVGINNNGIEEFKLDNTILLDKKYLTNLTGVFALQLAEKIIKKGIIYLLGFDWNRRDPKTIPIGKDYNPNSNLQIHYYDNIKHRGVGYVGYYENHGPLIEFGKLIKKDVKIYNVSLDSNINCFEKISYQKFFELLSPEIINQEEIRKIVKSKLL